MLRATSSGSYSGMLTLANTSPVAVSMTRMQPRGIYSWARPSHKRWMSASRVSCTWAPVPCCSVMISGVPVPISRPPADGCGLVAGVCQHSVPGAFQPGDAAAFLVEVAQQVHSNRAGQRTAGLVQQQYIGRGTDLTDFDQKGAGGIAALVQQGLRLVGHVGQQRGVAVVAGDAEGVAGGIGAGERAVGAVQEVAAGAG